MHSVEDALNHCFGRTLEIGVLDAQDERAALLTRKQPVEEGRTGSTEMKITSRRGGKSNSYTVRHKQKLSASPEKKGKLGEERACLRAEREVEAAELQAFLRLCRLMSGEAEPHRKKLRSRARWG